MSHWFCACVCSGHIPHHKYCSVYVLSRVQFAFHTTQFHTTLNIFTSHIIPSHHTKRFHTTFYITPFHITPPLHNIPHHIATYNMFHAISRRQCCNISPGTTIFYIWDHITLQSASAPPFHTTTNLKAHVPHCHTTTVHILHHSTSTTIPQHTTFNTTAYFTPHHTIFHIALHHHILTDLISHHHIWQHTAVWCRMWKMCWNCGDKECGMCCVMSDVENDAVAHHIAYATFFITTIPPLTFHITL